MDLKLQNNIACSEYYKELKQKLEKLYKENGTILMALQLVQDTYKFLNEDTIKIISSIFNISTSEVYSIATFYHQFSFNKKGKHRISLCMGTACFVLGANILLDKIKDYLKIDVNETTDDGLFSLDTARCVGSCSNAPVLIVDNDVYGHVKPDMIEEILKKYN